MVPLSRSIVHHVKFYWQVWTRLWRLINLLDSGMLEIFRLWFDIIVLGQTGICLSLKLYHFGKLAQYSQSFATSVIWGLCPTLQRHQCIRGYQQVFWGYPRDISKYSIIKVSLTISTYHVVQHNIYIDQIQLWKWVNDGTLHELVPNDNYFIHQ